MFAAVLMFCLQPVGMPQGCKGLEDLLGPYATEEACKARTEEMAKSLDEMLRAQRFVGHSRTKGVCKKDGPKETGA